MFVVSRFLLTHQVENPKRKILMICPIKKSFEKCVFVNVQEYQHFSNQINKLNSLVCKFMSLFCVINKKPIQIKANIDST